VEADLQSAWATRAWQYAVVRPIANRPPHFFRRLVLDGTPITNAGLSGLKELPALEDLSLARTQVGDAGLELLKIQKKLRRLVLDGCPVRGTGLPHLKELPNLTDLRLGCPTLTDLFAKNLGQLTKLERLSLATSGVTDDGLKRLSGLRNLRELELIGTKVTAAGTAELRRALPECNVMIGKAAK
jgi:Leucine-rich repeat (LRR) protein